MSENRKTSEDFVRIDLTDAQKQQIKRATGKDAESIELEVRELEQRIAPRYFVDGAE